MLELNTRIERITADKARILLERNTSNRGYITNNLNFLIREIKEGRWKLNGDAIRIAKDGTILDGQHRLKAIVDTGISCETFIIEGLDKDVFITIDQGQKRTLGHMLSVERVHNANVAASLMVLLHSYVRGFIPTRCANTVAKETMLKFYAERPFIDESASFVASNKLLRAWFTPAYLGMLHNIFFNISPEDCREFFDVLKTGIVESGRTQPIILRERMINIQALPKTKRETSVAKSAYAIFAWNAFRENRNITLLRWIQQGPAKQPYPKAK